MYNTTFSQDKTYYYQKCFQQKMLVFTNNVFSKVTLFGGVTNIGLFLRRCVFLGCVQDMQEREWVYFLNLTYHFVFSLNEKCGFILNDNISFIEILRRRNIRGSLSLIIFFYDNISSVLSFG